MIFSTVNVYGRVREKPGLPEYITDPSRPHQHYLNIVTFVVTARELDAILQMEESGIIKQYCHQLLVLTDRKRVLVVDAEGCSHARYTCVIDRETASHILSRV